MQFIYPYFLWGLLAVSIPVIIHLFKFRKFKKEYFSNVRFLQQMQLEHKKQSHLRELIILAARILAVVCLVFAFAQPFIPASNTGAQSGATRVSIYLDNSYSMDMASRNGRLLEEAKDNVRQLLKEFPDDAMAQLLTNHLSGNEQRFLSKKEILSYIEGIEPCPQPRSFSEIEARQAELKCNLRFYISDFQRSTFKLPEQKNDTVAKRIFIPLIPTQNENISIDSVWTNTPLLMPAKDISVKAIVTNYGDNDRDKISLKMFIDGKQSSVVVVDLPSGKSVEASLSVRFPENGFKQGYLEISDYPVQYDNRFYFTLPVSSNLSVLHIYESDFNSNIEKIFGNDSIFKYSLTSIKKIDYSAIPLARLIIIDEVSEVSDVLSGALKQAVENGASVVLIPQAVSAASPYSSLLSSLINSTYGMFKSDEVKVTSINLDNPVFKMALAGSQDEGSLPTVRNRFAIPINVSVPSEPLMSFNSSEDFMRVYEVGNGLLYLLSSSISKNNTDFTTEYSFVISFLNMALYSKNSSELYSTIGSVGGVRLMQWNIAPLDDTPFVLTDEKNDFSIMPQVHNINNEMLLFVNGADIPSGNYLLKKNKQTVSAISFNDNRKESIPEYYSAGELKEYGAVFDPEKISISEALSRTYQEHVLWKWFLISALVFLAIEILLIRLPEVKKIWQKAQSL
ncbi:MAG: BatA domain-containing protein [Bacteroidales bacterium]|nr:BatA domain-containing protein [Bacteroidales bacterium]